MHRPTILECLDNKTRRIVCEPGENVTTTARRAFGPGVYVDTQNRGEAPVIAIVASHWSGPWYMVHRDVPAAQVTRTILRMLDAARLSENIAKRAAASIDLERAAPFTAQQIAAHLEQIAARVQHLRDYARTLENRRSLAFQPVEPEETDVALYGGPAAFILEATEALDDITTHAAWIHAHAAQRPTDDIDDGCE